MSYGAHSGVDKNTHKTVLTIIVLIVINIFFSNIASGQTCLDEINVVNILKNKAWNASVSDGNTIDPGDIVIPINDAIIALWKRYYGSGETKVTDKGIVIAASFEAGNEGYAGLFVKYSHLLSYARVNIRVEVLEDNGGSIAIIFHSTWDNSEGGDKPKDPVLTITLIPLEAKLYVNGREYKLNNQKEYSINITITDDKANITIGSTNILTRLLPGNYSYITLMALSHTPGKSIKFIVKEFTLCSIESSKPVPPHQEYNPLSPIAIQVRTSTELNKMVNSTMRSIKNTPTMVMETSSSYENRSPEDILAHTTMYFMSSIILILIIATVVVFYFRFRK